jgi:hypothetical protein
LRSPRRDDHCRRGSRRADALASLTTDGRHDRAQCGTIRTTGAQTYNDAVTLGAATTLDQHRSGAIALANTSMAPGTGHLEQRSGQLSGVVGGVTPLASLSITSGDALVADATVSGASSVDAAGDIRIGTLRSGAITLTAQGDVTGLSAASSASDPNFGRANLTSTGGDIAIAGDRLVQLGAATASGGITIAAGNLAGSGNDWLDRSDLRVPAAATFR